MAGHPGVGRARGSTGDRNALLVQLGDDDFADDPVGDESDDVGESVHGISDNPNPRPCVRGRSNAIDHGGVVRRLCFPVGLDEFRRGRGCCHGRDVGEATDPSAVGSLVRSPSNVR